MKYGFRAYTGQFFTNAQVDYYNKLSTIIDLAELNKYGVIGIERLKDSRHRFFNNCSQRTL